jgi:phosphatidylglycerophosphate synthase
MAEVVQSGLAATRSEAAWLPTQQRWTLCHAILMLISLGASLAVGKAAPTALTCLGSLATWVWLQRARFAGVREFGAANSVTSLRVLLLACLAGAIDLTEPRWAALCSVSIFTLDGIDGWLARRANRASPFGAHYDMETDGCFVLILSIGLFELGRGAAWVLLAGALRYLYVIALQLARRTRAEAPRTSFGRYVFALVVVAFTVSLLTGPQTSELLAAAATLLLSYAFARGFYGSMRAPRDAQRTTLK